jgi:type III restriction enzyme
MPKTIVGYESGLPEIPDREPWEAPTEHLVRGAGGGFEIADGRRPSKTLLVNRLRDAVGAWRGERYPGASDVTQDLFRFWFEEDHVLADGRHWHYHFGQREAIETLAYLVEAARTVDAKELVDRFGEVHTGGLFSTGIVHQTSPDGRRSIVRFFPELGSEGTQDLPPEGLGRLAVKMATGSGKTIVMALLVAWSYFHRAQVAGSPLSRNFLIVAPNVIVYQRLERDFASNRIFEELPIVPPGWTLDLKPILRGESAEPSPSGTLFLTNVQQIHESRERAWTPENAVAALLGPPVAKDLASHERSMLERIRSLPDLVAINDEAHHVHDEGLEWAKTLLGMRDKLRLWLDFSATPKDQNGTYFPWIVTDYPLPQAVEDGIVKAPLIVQRVDRADPQKVTGHNVVEAYAEWLHAAVSRHQEHIEAYAPLGLRPVLFIMAEKSDYADKIGDSLRREKAFGFRPAEVLIIHTDTKGEITKRDLDRLRETAATIDDPGSRIKVIVSVLMLREGWDVRAVTVVLGLRPFTAKAQILPEQAVGRGLRLMPNTEGRQTLEVMGTRAFESFVQELEKEGLGVPVTKKPPALPVKVEPIRERSAYDIAIPLTQPLFGHIYRRLSELDPASIGLLGELPDVTAAPELHFVLEFMTTKSQVGELTLGYPMLVGEDAVGRLVDSVMDKAQLSGQFAELYPIIRRYVVEYAFGFPVSLDDNNVRGALSNYVFRERLAGHIARKIGELTVESRPLEFENPAFRLSDVPPFAWRRQHLTGEHTIFNFVTVYNDYERRFAEFLDTRPDILRWAALAEQFTRFHVTYLGATGALKRYYPDFVAVQDAGGGEVNWIIETKGRVFPDVEHKDRGIRVWCHTMREQTGQDWRYCRVDQLVFDNGQHVTFDALVVAVESAWAKAPSLGLVIDSGSRSL